MFTVVKLKTPSRELPLTISFVSRMVVAPGGGLNGPSVPVPVSTTGNSAWSTPSPAQRNAPLTLPRFAVVSNVSSIWNPIVGPASVWNKSCAPGFPCAGSIGFPMRSCTVGPRRIW
jgi:hypothetical protein